MLQLAMAAVLQRVSRGVQARAAVAAPAARAAVAASVAAVAVAVPQSAQSLQEVVGGGWV